MKNRICFLLLFFISFFSGAVSCFGQTIIEMNKIEGIVFSLSEFVESGVKIQYETNLEKESELENIKSLINKNYGYDVNIFNDQIIAKLKSFDIKVNTYSNNEKVFSEIEIINYDKTKKTSSLVGELTKFQNENLKNIRYFKYIKGKVNSVEEVIEGLNKSQEITNIDTLDIHNGYVGTANINNGERVNFAVNKYDTGSYLIIGTPIIFTTY